MHNQLSFCVKNKNHLDTLFKFAHMSSGTISYNETERFQLNLSDLRIGFRQTMSNASIPTSFPSEQRVVLDYVDWDVYEALVNSVESHRARMTYYCGILEIMSPGKSHETASSLLGRLVAAYTEELNIDIVSVDSMTFKRKDLKRGFEGDKAYYICNASLIRPKNDVNGMTDPPPDLVIEVDISRSSIDKFEVFGPLKVPEVWRYFDGKLEIHVLDGQSHRECKQSLALPGFPIALAEQILDQRTEISETVLVCKFREAL